MTDDDLEAAVLHDVLVIQDGMTDLILDAPGESARLRSIIDRAAEALGEVGQIALIDVHAYLARHDRPGMAHAVDSASAAIAAARAILAEADPASE